MFMFQNGDLINVSMRFQCFNRQKTSNLTRNARVNGCQSETFQNDTTLDRNDAMAMRSNDVIDERSMRSNSGRVNHEIGSISSNSNGEHSSHRLHHESSSVKYTNGCKPNQVENYSMHYRENGRDLYQYGTCERDHVSDYYLTKRYPNDGTNKEIYHNNATDKEEFWNDQEQGINDPIYSPKYQRE